MAEVLGDDPRAQQMNKQEYSVWGGSESKGKKKI